jgi:hypothetical protein
MRREIKWNGDGNGAFVEARKVRVRCQRPGPLFSQRIASDLDYEDDDCSEGRLYVMVA